MLRQTWRPLTRPIVLLFLVLDSIRTITAFSSPLPDLGSPMFAAKLGIRTASAVITGVPGLWCGNLLHPNFKLLHPNGFSPMRLSCTRTAPRLFASEVSGVLDGEKGIYNETNTKSQPANHLRSTGMLSRMYMKPSNRQR